MRLMGFKIVYQTLGLFVNVRKLVFYFYLYVLFLKKSVYFIL